MVEISNHLEVSELNGKATLKDGDRVNSVEFLKESETEDGEYPRFSQMSLKSDNLTIKITPSQLPWSLPDKLEINAYFFIGMYLLMEDWVKLEIMAFNFMLESYIYDRNDVGEIGSDCWMCMSS